MLRVPLVIAEHDVMVAMPITNVEDPNSIPAGGQFSFQKQWIMKLYDPG